MQVLRRPLADPAQAIATLESGRPSTPGAAKSRLNLDLQH